MIEAHNITVCYGDGVGPEIMDAALYVIKEAGASLSIETVPMGQEFYDKGEPTGIPASAWRTIRKNKLLLKGPTDDPTNRALKYALGTFVSVYPLHSLYPLLPNVQEPLNIVLCAPAQESLCPSMHYYQAGLYQEQRFFRRSNYEQAVRYAFDYAKYHAYSYVYYVREEEENGFGKAMLHDVFTQIVTEYKELHTVEVDRSLLFTKEGVKKLEGGVLIADPACIQAVKNHYLGISPSGSIVALAGSSYMGMAYSFFEPMHGTVNHLAGTGRANPSGMLRAAVMLLLHLDQKSVAERVINSWLRTIEDGIHTDDMFVEGSSTMRVGTHDFVEAIVDRIYKKPEKIAKAEYRDKEHSYHFIRLFSEQEKTSTLVGVDVFIARPGGDCKDIVDSVLGVTAQTLLKLQIAVAGHSRIWPHPHPIQCYQGYCQFRFLPPFSQTEGKSARQEDVLELLAALTNAGITYHSVQHLYTSDGQLGFSLLE